MTGRRAPVARRLAGAAVARFAAGAALGVVLLAVAASCANPSAPPGGPADLLPPQLLRATPASGDTSVRPRVVELVFDEVISETPAGAPDLAALVFVSPRSEKVRVDWKRNRITIRPSEGFRDSSVYTITLRPGLQDLRNNRIDSLTTFVFSTRGPIPASVINGVLFDWPAGRGVRGGLVEAVPAGDTTVAYVAVTDSVGRYALRHLPRGVYLVRGFADRNNNRRLERSELMDTVRLALGDSTGTDLYAFIRDTTPPRLASLVLQDSGRLLVATFDKPLSPTQVLVPDQFALYALPDSTPLPVRALRVRTRRQQALADSLEAKRRADSLAAVRDTARPDSAAQARADSLARRRRLDSLAGVERAQREQRRLLTLRGGRPLPPPDTTPPPRPAREIPGTELLVLFEAPLPENTRVLVEARGITSLNGVVGAPARPLLVPRRDTTRRDTTRRDTTRRGTARGDSAGGDSARRDMARRETARRDPDTGRQR
jgi:hypothetical protein